jgi:hypothetical protein
LFLLPKKPDGQAEADDLMNDLSVHGGL